MTHIAIVGAGASGLFTAWRLFRDKNYLRPGDTIAIYEWSNAHVGGRIHTYYFPTPDGQDRQYIEAGGMRLAADKDFPGSIQTGHILVQNLLKDLGFEHLDPFIESSDRRYYLRGQHVQESLIPETKLPYNFDNAFVNYGFDKKTADDILAAAAATFASPTQWTRAQWCDYFESGALNQQMATALGDIYPANTNIGDIGYWNLLYAFLGDEGFDYVSDANGYQSNVINWNSADAMQANTDFGSGVKYRRVPNGYGRLFEKLASEIQRYAERREQRIPVFNMGTRLVSFVHNVAHDKFHCLFEDANTGAQSEVVAEVLMLAMPRRAIELIAARCEPSNTLNQPAVMNFLQSSIDQPAMRIGMLFEKAWWTDPTLVQYPLIPNPAFPNKPDMGGPTITDLPLRQVFYFGNNLQGAKQNEGPYVMLASYDDMTYAAFWEEMEITGRRRVAPSLNYQALNGPTELTRDSPMVNMALEQLGLAHGVLAGKTIPKPLTAVFMDWGTDPFGGGYHGWAAHYDICEVMTKIRAPGQLILGKHENLYIIGSCYSIDQAWVEGALCVAESVLEDFFGIDPFCTLPPGYVLICTPQACAVKR
jgi:hypothetical protein